MLPLFAVRRVCGFSEAVFACVNVDCYALLASTHVLVMVFLVVFLHFLNFFLAACHDHILWVVYD